MKKFNYTVGSVRSSPFIKGPSHTLQNQQPEPTTRHSEYGTLSKAVSKHLRKKKKKDSLLLQMELEETVRRQIQHQQRSHSLDKLVFINRQKNEEIRRHILEKANLHSENEELKRLMIGPSERQQELQKKVNQLQIDLVKTRSEFQQRELKYKEQIQDIKREHRKQLNQLREKYENVGKANIATVERRYEQPRLSPENSRKYIQPVNYVTREQSPPKRQNQYGNIQTIPAVKASANPTTNYLSSSNANYHANTQANYLSSNTQVNYNSNSRSSYSPPHPPQGSQEQTNYTNVFSQSNIRTANYPTHSPRRQQIIQTYSYKRQPSPNTTNNTTNQIKTETKTDIGRGQSSQEYNLTIKNPTGQSSHYQQYRNVIQREELAAERPTTFGGEAGPNSNQSHRSAEITQSSRKANGQRQVVTSGISTKDIDDIYKRYYLHD